MAWLSYFKAAGKRLDNLEDLFHETLKELYDVEDQIIDALPKMRDAAYSPELKRAFDSHLEVTRRQKERLEELFQMLSREPEPSRCEAIRGIISDGEVLMKADGDPSVKDAALIAAGQQVEHYEMALYGTARTFARFLGWEQAERILQATLDEEGETDKELTDIAVEAGVNLRAAKR
jgi:ferritin-like metal-binding protein YciE